MTTVCLQKNITKYSSILSRTRIFWLYNQQVSRIYNTHTNITSFIVSVKTSGMCSQSLGHFYDNLVKFYYADNTLQYFTRRIFSIDYHFFWKVEGQFNFFFMNTFCFYSQKILSALKPTKHNISFNLHLQNTVDNKQQQQNNFTLRSKCESKLWKTIFCCKTVLENKSLG